MSPDDTLPDYVITTTEQTSQRVIMDIVQSMKKGMDRCLAHLVACHSPNTAVDEEAQLEATLSASRLLVSARRNLYLTNGARLPEMGDVVLVKGHYVCRSESIAATRACTARGCVEGVLASLETNMAMGNAAWTHTQISVPSGDVKKELCAVP
jgi:hypothetical protein